MKRFDLGRVPYTKQREAVRIDLDKLVESRLLVQANSGAGKSWTLRRILEKSAKSIQQIVIDPEDEFYTLREKYDFVLAGRDGGDCPAEPRSAALLARRLLELRVSAVVGIYELKAYERLAFVRTFLDALVNAPKKLWHPCLVVVDEAHVFCPEKGKAESAGAVIDLMTRGRKRGFCGVLATQRLAKLHKDAAAEANNKLIGRTALDIDIRRAADELGESYATAREMLRRLAPGVFKAYGPAIAATGVQTVKVGQVETTHPKAGARYKSSPAPAARSRVKKVLGKLADLPAEAREETRTLAEAKKEISKLRGELTRAKKAQPEPKKETIEVSVFPPESMKRLAELQTSLDTIEVEIGLVRQDARPLLEEIKTASGRSKPRSAPPPAPARARRSEPAAGPYVKPPAGDNGWSSETALAKCPRSILAVLCQFREGRTRPQLAIQSGYSLRSSTFANGLSALTVGRYMEKRGDLFYATDPKGLDELVDVGEAPTGEELLEYWRNQLGRCPSSMLAELATHGDLSRSQLAAATLYSLTSSTFANGLSKLRTLGLIEGRDPIRLAEILKA